MEIKNNVNRLDPYLNRLQTEKGEGRSAAQEAAQAAAPARDTVQIKSPGLKAAIEESAAGAPDIREDKVAAIKASIAGGSYQIDSRAIASKLVAEAGDLF